jgi:hypothetical protein
MSSYSSQITPQDRWAVVAWIRTLQASQNMPREFLAKDDEGKLNASAASGGAAATAPFLEGEKGGAAAHPAPGEAPAAPEPHSPSKKSSSSSSESSEPR